MDKNYYQILGIEKSSTEAEIKKAYRKLAMKHHPDKNNGSKDSEEIFKKINEAYDVLSNPTKRKEYDLQLEFANQSRNSRNFKDAHFEFNDYDEIFNHFANHIFTQKQVVEVHFDFWEGVFGCIKEFQYGKQNIQIRFPAGIHEGEQLSFQYGKKTLHIIAKVEYKNDSAYREGLDLYIKTPIPFTTAILGGKLLVPHWDGDIQVNIPEGTNQGTKLRIFEKGIKREKFIGNLYLICEIKLPDSINKKQKELIVEFEKEAGKTWYAKIFDKFNVWKK